MTPLFNRVLISSSIILASLALNLICQGVQVAYPFYSSLSCLAQWSFEVILLVSVISLTAFGKSSPNNSKEIGLEGAQRYL